VIALGQNPCLPRSSWSALKRMNPSAKRGIMPACERQFTAGRRGRGAPRRHPSPPPPLCPPPLCYAFALSPTSQREALSAVAWEERERGGRYYTRSRREGGRVVREYVGGGLAGERAEEEDRARRELEEAQREREREDIERIKALAAPVLEVSEAAEILARAHLVAAAYHRRKGEYRRARG
jgi:hypothetical protein